MKKILVFLALFLPLSVVTAQREYLPTVEDLEQFAKTKTYVVLQDNPISEYNFEIMEAVKKYWNITEYEFIEFDQFEEKTEDVTASFLYTARVDFEKDRSQTRYIFLCLSIGGNYPSLDEMKDVVNIPLGYYGVDEDSYSYKLGTLVNFMQNHVRLITKDPSIISQNVFEHYNDNMAEIQGKTLYLIKKEVDVAINTEAKIKTLYPYPVKFVTQEEIKEAIMNKEEDVVFLHKVGPEGKKLNARVYKVLIGAGDSKFYYFDFHKINDKKFDVILPSDLKKLGKAKKKK